MSTAELHLVFLLIGFAVGLWHTWIKGYNKGYDEGYFDACEQVARGEITVKAVEVDDDEQ